MLDPLNGLVTELLPEFLLAQCSEMSEAELSQRCWHSEAGFGANLSKPVPRTGLQAIVTSVNPVANRVPELEGDSSFVLDRKIGNATASIQLVWGGNGVSWTNFDAFCA